MTKISYIQTTGTSGENMCKVSKRPVKNCGSCNRKVPTVYTSEENDNIHKVERSDKS